MEVIFIFCGLEHFGNKNLYGMFCVAAQQRPVIGTLTRLFNETSEALGGSRAVPAKKREIDDNSKKIGALFAKLNNGDISKNAAEKLVQLCQALDHGDFPTALKIQVSLSRHSKLVFTIPVYVYLFIVKWVK